MNFLSELFGAVKEIASLVPEFDERKKNMIERKTQEYHDISKRFNKLALEFTVGSRSDELLGVADMMKHKEKELKDLYVLYAKEIKGES